MSQENEFPSKATPSSSTAVFPIAQIVKGKLLFEHPDQIEQAMTVGAFYLKIPEHIDMEPGDHLAKNFYKDHTDDAPDYTGYKQRSFDKSTFGYADRPCQVEQFQLELACWDQYFPKKVCDVVAIMNLLSVQVLENMLGYFGVAEDDWEQITGGALDNKAGHIGTFSHYRTEKETIGIVGHKDGGYVTLLHATLPGYEVKIGDDWCPMDPKEGYFIVNLGQCLEILTANLKKRINAPEHRVRQMHSNKQVEDRTSIALFVTPRFDSRLYQYDEAGGLEVYRDYVSFLKERFRKINYTNDRVEDIEAKTNTSDSNTQFTKFSELYDD